MADAAKIRVVRCPKCEKLLPELPDYTLYRCGGCNTTLQAKRPKSSNAELSPENSEEKVRVRENSGSVSKEKQILSEATPETDLGSIRVESREKESNSAEEASNFFDNTSSLRENDAILGDRLARKSKAQLDGWVPSHSVEGNSESDKPTVERERKIKGEADSGYGFGKFRERRTFERDGFSAYRRPPRAITEDVDFSRQPEAGPSTYRPHRNYGSLENPNADCFDRLELAEQDRAELLRKLDELRDKLSRSCDVSEKPREQLPANKRTASPSSYSRSHNEWHPGSSSVPSQFFQSGDRRPPLFQNQQISLVNARGVAAKYPPLHPSNEILRYCDPFTAAHLLSEGNPNYRDIPQRQSKDHFHGHCMEGDCDPMLMHRPNAYYGHSSCSCLNCQSKPWQMPVQVPPPVFTNQMLQDCSGTCMNYHERPTAYGLGRYDYRAPNALLRAHEHVYHTRNPSDSRLDVSNGGFRRLLSGRPMVAPRAGLLKDNMKKCDPIAGGAPFMTCSNCSELLQLPKNLLSEKCQNKLSCGSCSEVIPYIYKDKKVIFPFPVLSKNTLSEISNDSSEMVKEEGSNSQLEERILDTSDDDFEKLGEARPVLSPPNTLSGKEQLPNFNRFEKPTLVSPSSSSSEESAERIATQKNDVHLNAELSSSVPTSPCEHFDCSPINRVGGKFGKGSRSQRSEQETAAIKKGALHASRQNSVKDVSLATEMECSEYPNSGISQDSAEVRKEDQIRAARGGESFFAGLIKKSLGRSSQHVENGKYSISINGQPVPDRMVKKAEKQAGPIHPGHYWYDYRAGFWGVMGHQCLGIIPPLIEEFNYPMPKNCSGGSTGVLVNGRELQQKDLELLAGRGLPVTRDKSYILEISGRVFDETSGEELDSLGRLAPTVEKLKCGFGLHVPRGMARSIPSEGSI